MVSLGGPQGSKRKQPPRGHKEGASAESRAPKWFLLGLRSRPLPPLDGGPHFGPNRGEESTRALSTPHTSRRRKRRPLERGEMGEPLPVPPLRLRLRTGPVSARTPPPAHLSRAGRPPCGQSARPHPARPAPHRRQLQGSRPEAPARPPSPTVPGQRRQRGCSSRTRSALPRSPRSRSPAAGDGSSTLLARAAWSRQHQAQDTL